MTDGLNSVWSNGPVAPTDTNPKNLELAPPQSIMATRLDQLVYSPNCYIQIFRLNVLPAVRLEPPSRYRLRYWAILITGKSVRDAKLNRLTTLVCPTKYCEGLLCLTHGNAEVERSMSENNYSEVNEVFCLMIPQMQSDWEKMPSEWFDQDMSTHSTEGYVCRGGSRYTEDTKIIGIQKEVTFRCAQKHHKGTGNTRRVALNRTCLSWSKLETTRCHQN